MECLVCSRVCEDEREWKGGGCESMRELECVRASESVCVTEAMRVTEAMS